jgi:hypothetical protein
MMAKQRKGNPAVTWVLMPEADKLVSALVEREVMKFDGEDIRRFTHLDDAAIVCVGRPKAQIKDGFVRVASIRKAKPVERLFLERAGHGERVTHLLEIGLDVWNAASPLDREITLFHELCHPKARDDQGKWGGMRQHPIQEFPEVVERYGAYTPALKRMVKAGQMVLPLHPVGA